MCSLPPKFVLNVLISGHSVLKTKTLTIFLLSLRECERSVWYGLIRTAHVANQIAENAKIWIRTAKKIKTYIKGGLNIPNERGLENPKNTISDDLDFTFPTI